MAELFEPTATFIFKQLTPICGFVYIYTTLTHWILEDYWTTTKYYTVSVTLWTKHNNIYSEWIIYIYIYIYILAIASVQS